MSMASVEIDADDTVDRWRWVCPNGHRSWEPTNNHFYCKECARQTEHGADADPVFSKLRDARTGETFSREEIEIRGYKTKTV